MQKLTINVDTANRSPERMSIPTVELTHMFNLTSAEIARAEDKHPNFCNTIEQAALIVGEELGEVFQAVVDYSVAGKVSELGHIKEELIQVAATVYRMLQLVESIPLRDVKYAAGVMGEKGHRGEPGVMTPPPGSGKEWNGKGGIK